MKLYWVWAILLCLFTSTASWGQEEEDEEEKDRPSLKERLYYSGGAQLQFGNATVIGLSPNVGYKFNDILSLGLGLSYQYSKYRAGTYLINGIPYSVGDSEPQHTYGGKLFGRAKTPIDVFVHAEWETLNAFIPGFSRGREWYSALLVGGGYSVAVGGNSSMNIMMLYNLNRSSNGALYRTEFIPRVEFSYNF